MTRTWLFTLRFSPIKERQRIYFEVRIGLYILSFASFRDTRVFVYIRHELTIHTILQIALQIITAAKIGGWQADDRVGNTLGLAQVGCFDTLAI